MYSFYICLISIILVAWKLCFDSFGGSMWSESRSLMSDSLRPHGLYSPWNSPGQNTGVGSLSLLQGIFPTQGLNPGLPHCRQVLYQLSHRGSPRITQWAAYPFSRGSSQSRNQTRVSCIAGRNLYQLSDQGDSMMPKLTHLVNTKYYIMGDCSLFKAKYIFLGCQRESQAAVE